MSKRNAVDSQERERRRLQSERDRAKHIASLETGPSVAQSTKATLVQAVPVTVRVASEVKQPHRGKFGVSRLEMCLAIVIATTGVAIPMTGVQPNYWIALIMWTAILALSVDIVWRWDGCNRIQWYGKSLVSAVLVGMYLWLVFIGPLKERWNIEHRVTSFPYPWPTLTRIISNGTVKSIALRLGVFEYPESRAADRNSLRNTDTLYKVQMKVSRVTSVRSDDSGWYSCRVHTFDEPEWSNRSFVSRTISAPYYAPSTVLLVEASARNGRWRGIIHMTGEGGDVRNEDWISGHFLVDGKPPEKMALYRTRDGKIGDEASKIRISAAALKMLGVREIDPKLQDPYGDCAQADKEATGAMLIPGTVMTIDHNFGETKPRVQ